MQLNKSKRRSARNSESERAHVNRHENSELFHSDDVDVDVACFTNFSPFTPWFSLTVWTVLDGRLMSPYDEYWMNVGG